MIEGERLEEIFDRYMGLEFLEQSWRPAAETPGYFPASRDDHRTPAGELPLELRREALLRAAAGTT